MFRTNILVWIGSLVFLLLAMLLLPTLIAVVALSLLYIAIAAWQFATFRQWERQEILQTRFLKRLRPSTVLWTSNIILSLLTGAGVVSMMALFSYDAREPMQWGTSLLQAIGMACCMMPMWGVSLHADKKKREDTIQMQK